MIGVKKQFTKILGLILCLCLVILAGAWTVNCVDYDEFGNTVYVNTVPQSNIDNVDEAMALLTSLDIEEEIHAHWDEETVLTVANSEKITISVETYQNGRGQDQLKMYHALIYLGEGEYLFSTDCCWLNMPQYRGYDIIGSGEQMIAFIPGTCKMSWGCRQTFVNNNDVSENQIVNSTLNYAKQLVDNVGPAPAVGFRLPLDGACGEVSVKYDNLWVHYEYKGMVMFPTRALNFSSVGQYIHTDKNINNLPSLVLSPGAGLNIQQKDYSAWINASYYPAER